MESFEYMKEIPTLIRRANYKIDSILRAVVEKHDLTCIQSLLLMQLRHYGGHTIGALGKVTGLLSANVSATCKRLEQMGLLRRSRTRDDERFVKIELTEKGETLVDRIELEIDERCSSVISRKTDHELARTVVMLKCLLGTFSEICIND